MLTASLPPALERALAQQAGAGEGRARASADLSRRYRRADAGTGPVAASDEDVLAYAATRLPATYAAVRVVLGELAARLPSFLPATHLDLGAGPGTALWAAADVWPQPAARVAVEARPEMRRLAATLGGAAESVEGTLPAAVPAGVFDLVTAAYLLGELDDSDRGETVERAWSATGGALVVVEPGTPAGCRRVLAARDLLLALGAELVAPCPHALACPLAGTDDWCHFAVRLPRASAHRAAKQARLGHEDEKFSYLVAARVPVELAGERVLRHPQVRSGHVLLELCTREGLRHQTVSRRHGERYRAARRVSWGEDLART